MTSLLLLTGGASKRMGRDKAALPLGSADLKTFQAQRLRQAGFAVVAGLEDIHSGYLGPLAGIHAALVRHPEVSDWLVVPVDMPALSIKTLTELVAYGEHHRQPCCYQDAPLPLFLPVSVTLAGLLSGWLCDSQGPRSVQQLLKHLGGRWLVRPQAEADFININTPQQWQQFSAEAACCD